MLNFGICLKGDMPMGRMVNLAQTAEDGGFTYCWIFDSHMLWRDCTPVLGYLAAHTNLMKLGPLVTNPTVRDVTVTASVYAGINNMTGGRAVLGIGRGDSSRRVLGKKPTTIKGMMKAIEDIRDLAEGRTMEYADREQFLTWANPDYKLPMWIAGYGPKVLHASGAHADGIVLQIADPELIPWFVAQVHKGAEDAGRDPKEIKIMACAAAWVGDDIDECRKHVKWFPAMVGNHVADIVEKHAGNLEEIPKDFIDYIEKRKGYNYREHADKNSDHLDFIPDNIIDRFCVIGTPEQHVEKLKKLKEAGVDQFCMYLMSDQEERNLDAYCNDIMPEVNKW